MAPAARGATRPSSSYPPNHTLFSRCRQLPKLSIVLDALPLPWRLLTSQELNHRGTHLLFRDKKRHLSLYNIQVNRT